MEGLKLNILAAVAQQVHHHLEVSFVRDVSDHHVEVGAIEEDLAKQLQGLPLGDVVGRHDELGVGGNGFVLHGRRNRDGLEVAIKVVQRTERSTRRWPVHPKYGQVPNDVIVMEALDHGNIARMLDVFSDDRYVYVVSCQSCFSCH